MAHGGSLSLSTACKILGPQGPLSLGVPGALGALPPWPFPEQKKIEKNYWDWVVFEIFPKNVVFITSPTRHTYVHPSIRPSIPRYKKFRKLKIADF